MTLASYKCVSLQVDYGSSNVNEDDTAVMYRSLCVDIRGSVRDVGCGDLT